MTEASLQESLQASGQPKWLYLHGFGSSPSSTKARAIAEHFEGRSNGLSEKRARISISRLDLRKPSFERMRLSAMIAHAGEAIGTERDRAVVFGSSLGGLTAARLAEEDARVSALVLLAPAFRMAERWRARVGEATWRAYRESGFLEADDYLEKRKRKVDFGFFEDVAAVDARSGGWPDVRVPTLIIHGVHDEVVGVDLSRTWARGKRHVRLVEVDDGHELAKSIACITQESEAFLAGYLNRRS